ncbi:MAG: DUF177 domain-containing protein [Muribaculaceae bacterium]|nr:DUF177 domain-containing protein [Muribaculaceae bacterium]MDE5856998.1 DUF177 domain-containing protein [Muribaculaceae bacterium]MDE7370124.1 DUF177 domain-containing protein [Muribaculaceae bacterium]
MLKSLPKGTHTFEYHLDKQFFVNMENTDVRDADVNVVLTLVYNGTFYDLTFDVTGTVTLLCDRCLDNLDVPIETQYHVVVKFGESYDDSSDEMLVIPESDNYLNVAYLIYDTVMLAIPIKHVHPLGKCNRAMSALLKKHRSQGVDDELENQLIDEMDDMDTDQSEPATDPRWDALKKLQDDSENN